MLRRLLRRLASQRRRTISLSCARTSFGMMWCSPRSIARVCASIMLNSRRSHTSRIYSCDHKHARRVRARWHAVFARACMRACTRVCACTCAGACKSVLVGSRPRRPICLGVCARVHLPPYWSHPHCGRHRRRSAPHALPSPRACPHEHACARAYVRAGGRVGSVCAPTAGWP